MSNPFDRPADQLVANFYAWEKRGRGWDLYPHPVELEPPFRPFTQHVYLIPPRPHDGQSPGILARLRGTPCRAAPRLVQPEVEDAEPEPTPARSSGQLAEMQVLLPDGFTPAKHSTEQLISAARVCCRPVSFELVGRCDAVSLNLACHPAERGNLVQQVQAGAPDAVVLPRPGFLSESWQAAISSPLIVDLGLSCEFMRPLRIGESFHQDPLASIVAALGSVEAGEILVFQVIVQKSTRPWAESIMRVVHDNEGGPFFATGPELVAQAKHKVSSPLYACRMRLAARARSHSRTIELARALLSSLSQFSTPLGNELIALDSAGWEEADQTADLLTRQSHRTGMLLSAAELSSLVHFPGRDITHPRFARLTGRSRRAPAITLGHQLVLGDNSHAGTTEVVTLSAEQRMRHTYLIGASGTGKSTLLLNLILQDIEAGQGVAVLDPHGDLVDAVLARIPEGRTEDVVLVDPADEEYPVGFNVLSAHSDLERRLLSSDLVAVFRRLSTSWGDQMNSVFANAILAFLESSTGGTLGDLRRFLVDKEFRGRFLRSVQDPEVVYYWTHEFPLLRGNAQAPILTRLDAFLRPKPIRHMVCQPHNRLDFGRIMGGRQILLAKLSHGAIGEENSYLLGSVIVAKLHQAAISRQEQAAADRADFFVYLDEFHNFITPSLTSLLSGVRKYRMALTLAHQDLQQLGGPSSEIASSVLGNAATRVVFRIGDGDAKRLAEGFASFEARDLQNLGVGEAVARMERSDFDFNLSTLPVAAVDPAAAEERQQQVRDASRRQYSTPRAELELPRPEPPAEAPSPKVYVPAVVPAPATPLPIPPRPAPSAPALPGRGGPQHKYLQTLIKRFGEDRGFRATIEQAVLDGHGSVDVALEREGCRLAVEITVTTPTTHELGNLSKCLAAGFDHVVLVALDKTAQKRLNTAATSALPEGVRERVRCVTPELIPALLDELVVAAPVTETVAGYKVSVQYSAPESEGKRSRLHGVRDIIARSLKRQTPP